MNTDIDECLAGTHLCNQTCTNNIGSYTCGCTPGYQLDEDGFNCEGISANNNGSLLLFESSSLTQMRMSVEMGLTHVNRCVSIPLDLTFVDVVKALDYTVIDKLASVRILHII